MKKTATRSFDLHLTVPFHDLDPLHIVWHGNYLKYFDMVRFGLFKNAGIDLYDYYRQTRYLFPITKTTTKHIIPLGYGDAFICRARVLEAQIKIVMDFEIHRLEDGEICTRGRSEQVAVKSPGMEMMLEIPRDIRAALGFNDEPDDE